MRFLKIWIKCALLLALNTVSWQFMLYYGGFSSLEFANPIIVLLPGKPMQYYVCGILYVISFMVISGITAVSIEEKRYKGEKNNKIYLDEIKHENQKQQGNWIRSEGEVCYHYTCSVCEDYVTDGNRLTNFCPNCGAKMNRSKEGNGYEQDED